MKESQKKKKEKSHFLEVFYAHFALMWCNAMHHSFSLVANKLVQKLMHYFARYFNSFPLKHIRSYITSKVVSSFSLLHCNSTSSVRVYEQTKEKKTCKRNAYLGKKNGKESRTHCTSRNEEKKLQQWAEAMRKGKMQQQQQQHSTNEKEKERNDKEIRMNIRHIWFQFECCTRSELRKTRQTFLRNTNFGPKSAPNEWFSRNWEVEFFLFCLVCLFAYLPALRFR